MAIKSKIQDELVKATGVKPDDYKDRQKFLHALMMGVSKLNDADFDKISDPAADWNNEVVDAYKSDKNKDLADFADIEADEPAKRTRRSADDGGSTVMTPKVGDTCEVTNSRDVTKKGVVVEIDDKVLVLDVPGEGPIDYSRDRIKSTNVLNGASAKDEPAGEFVPKVGLWVAIKTKRGRECEGKIVEIDKENLTLEVDGKDEDFARDRVETIKAVASKGEKADDSGKGKDDGKTKDAGEGGKEKRASNPEGVSVGTRIMEIIADDLDVSEEAVGKQLKKDGLEFKDNTLTMQYKQARKMVEILRKKKMLK